MSKKNKNKLECSSNVKNKIQYFAKAIDKKSINRIQVLFNSYVSKKDDVALEMYKNNLLTVERLQFIFEKCSDYINVSSSLITKLIKDDNMKLLDFIFDNFKFFDVEFIKFMLLHYKNKEPISKSDLNQFISNDKYKISRDNDDDKKYDLIFIKRFEYNDIDNNSSAYLFNACKKGYKHLVKFLVEHGIDINKESYHGKTSLYFTCSSGNIEIVKYLVEHGADINKEDNMGRTPLYKARLTGNKTIEKYLIERGAHTIVKEKFDKIETISQAEIHQLNETIGNLISRYSKRS